MTQRLFLLAGAGRRQLPCSAVVVLLLSCLCCPAAPATADGVGDAEAAAAKEPDPADHAALPAGVRRVLFLGDSITYSGQYVAFIESYFRTRHPARRLEFINAGLPSETVSGLSEAGHADGKFPRPDLHERLDRVLEQVRPDLVFACYGMNDGIYLPPDEGRFGKFSDGMKRLRERVMASGARLVHLTPPPFDGTRAPGGDAAGYDRVLAGYAEWLLARRADGWDVIDLHGPMNSHLAEQRRRDPAFALANDGVHPGDPGHWLIARQVLLHLGAADLAEDADNARAAMLAAHPRGEQVLELVRQRQAIMRDAWLTATKHERPGIAPGLPLDEAEAKAAELDQRIDELSK